MITPDLFPRLTRFVIGCMVLASLIVRPRVKPFDEWMEARG